MRRRRQRKPVRPVIGCNLTPMVDIIFLLTIFFMLVSRFSSAEQVPMDLPAPHESQAKTKRVQERVIVNCRLASMTAGLGGQVLYSIGPNQPEPLERLAERLSAMKAANPALQVVLRADRRIAYSHVRAVMRVIARTKIDILNVVAHVSEDN